ncbi:hypothetical protein FOL47_009714, partial [Perkinsus chesapeaki]
FLLFGKRLEEWSTAGKAINTAFLFLMGDFSFKPMSEVAPISAAVWFWVFMILVFLVMLNMLLAIVMDTYTNVKEAAKAADSVPLPEKLLQSERWSWRRLLGLKGREDKSSPVTPRHAGLGRTRTKRFTLLLEALEPEAVDWRSQVEKSSTNVDLTDCEEELVTLEQLMAIGIPAEEGKALLHAANTVPFIVEEGSKVEEVTMDDLKAQLKNCQDGLDELKRSMKALTDEVRVALRHSKDAPSVNRVSDEIANLPGEVEAEPVRISVEESRLKF